MRILLSIPSLAAGGAERQFAALASGLAARGHEVLAVTLGRGGSLAASLGQARLVELNKTSRWDSPRVALALAGLLRRAAPQVHYAFLPSCCVLGGLLAPFFPAVRLALGVRATNVAGLDPAARLLLALEARLSRRAGLVIANSRAGLRHCLGRGFAAARAVVVPNGIDTERYRPDKTLGAALRKAWGASEGHRLIGLVARLDPMKDHGVFLEAATRLAMQRPEARFVCVGAGPAAYADALRGKAESLGLAGRLAWAGEQTDMAAVYNALDCVCLSSASGEGFPNVLGEAMACGVPCVATDVGDAALVLGGTGVVARPGDAEGLADGLAALLARTAQEGDATGESCRQRIVTEFSAARMVAATEALLREL
ncbi:glycosyltransferase [Humidesulfovibrio idahonensis]